MTTKTFRDFPLDDRLVDALEDQGITHPFPIQELTLPMALRGADIIGQARTGTGKTLGFGLPLLQRVDPDVEATQALVVVPTRELCLQVAGDLRIGERRGLTLQTVYGGVGYDEQIDALTGNVHIVVGTPGRLLDHLNRGNLDLSQVRVLVLDEADEMLDMGFLPDVERLINACTYDERHTMLFSATMPSAVVKLARRYMTKPTFMRADVEDHETAPNVEQHFLLVHRMDKPRVLARILQSPGRGSVYVFTRTKRMADRLVSELGDLGVDAIAVHGDLRQATREKNMDRFREGTTNVLVATEVAARGLDVEDATHVVNYDCPDDEKMYLHRIGRTARAGQAGVAVTFAEFNEVDRLNVIRKAVQAEREIIEVFSTSDELTERFALPEQTPWDHLTRSRGGDREPAKRRDRDDDRGRSGDRDRGKGRDGDRGKSGDSGSRGKSRDSDRGKDRAGDRGKDRPARRRQEDATATEAEEARASFRRERSRGDSATSAHPPTLGDRDEKAETVRTRTRSTERGQGQPRQQGAAAGDQRSQGRERQRARGGGRQRARGGERGSGGDAGDGGREDGGRRGDGGARRGGRTESARNAGRQDRGDRGGGRDEGGGRDDRGGRAAEETPTTTRRGDDARGEGRPALARRVKVEHLP